MAWYPLVLFLFGTCLGSFLNVVSLRAIAGIMRDASGSTQYFSRNPRRSACPQCKQTLRWWELVPLLSFIVLRGRCARCGTIISPHYPIVEFAMGVLVVLIGTPLPMSALSIFSALLTVSIAALLIILFVIDLKTMLLPDGFILALGGVILLHELVSYQLQATSYKLSDALFGAAIGAGFLLFLWAITRGRGIGLGDIKLMLPLGFVLGPVATVTLLFLAYTVGGLLAVYLLLRHRANLKTALPFGPFLCGAALVILVFPQLPEVLVTLMLGYNPW